MVWLQSGLFKVAARATATSASGSCCAAAVLGTAFVHGSEAFRRPPGQRRASGLLPPEAVREPAHARGVPGRAGGSGLSQAPGELG